MKREIITNNDPKSPVSEVFRTLRTNMQYMNNKNTQTIVMTSTMQGEGKSFVVANLAVTYAQAGKHTLIIDADMRRPRQHKIFKTTMYPGLSNYLSGVSVNRQNHENKLNECIYKTKIKNLFILPAGNIPPNPSELLQSGKLPKMIEQLQKVFDVIIFDGAPCLLVTDATIIARLVDYTILVASQNKTKLDELKEAKRRIKHVGGKIAGVVLNRVKVSKKIYENKYYYGSKENLQVKPNSYDDYEDDMEKIRPSKSETEVKFQRPTEENTRPMTSDRISDIVNQINKYKEEN